MRATRLPIEPGAGQVTLTLPASGHVLHVDEQAGKWWAYTIDNGRDGQPEHHIDLVIVQTGQELPTHASRRYINTFTVAGGMTTHHAFEVTY